MSNRGKLHDTKWGERKNHVAFMLTPTASESLSDIAEAMGLSRSEALERIVRHMANQPSTYLRWALTKPEE